MAQQHEHRKHPDETMIIKNSGVSMMLLKLN